MIALNQALIMGKLLAVNIYLGSPYAFATAHVHGVIYQEKELLTAEGKTIKNKYEILQLLKAFWSPKRMTVVHCPSHQKAITLVVTGINLADKAAKGLALGRNSCLCVGCDSTRATKPQPARMPCLYGRRDQMG